MEPFHLPDQGHPDLGRGQTGAIACGHGVARVLHQRQ